MVKKKCFSVIFFLSDDPIHGNHICKNDIVQVHYPGESEEGGEA